jgi:bacterioferritin-associated ferredoxin
MTRNIITLWSGNVMDHEPVYVCLCNALSDAEVRRAATLLGACRPAEVFHACGCRAQCGTCARTMRDLLRHEAARPKSIAPAAAD